MIDKDYKFGGLTLMSTIDYPGKISSVIYTRGCNFDCEYCHNYHLNYSHENSYSMKWEQIQKTIKNHKMLIDGIVITGGEPTLHRNKLIDLCKWLKEQKLLVKLDTNGSNPDIVNQLVNCQLIDFVAMDIKSTWDKYDEVARVKVNVDNLKKTVDIIKKELPENCDFRTTIHSKYHTINDIKAIANIVGIHYPYSLQLCRPTSRFKCKNKYTIKKLIEIRDVLNSEGFNVKVK